MNTEKETKLKRLLDKHVQGTVLPASWLEKEGFSYDLQKRYRKSGWLESVGTGAFKRPQEQLKWQGGIFALQTRTEIPVHVGGLTALSMQGASHYFRMNNEKIFLFSPLKTKLPLWFMNYNWENPVEHIKTSFIPEHIGLSSNDENNFNITVSSAERAFLECLYLAPNKMDLTECYQILSGLTNLRPKLVRELLEKCTSIKVKRLFLYMAKKTQHQWFGFVDTSSVDLGKGDRSIAKNGVYNSEFKITVPKEIAEL